MTSRSRFVRIISLLAVALLFSGCVFIDRLKQGLSPPPVSDKQPENTGPSQDSPLLDDALHFAGHIHHMPEDSRIKNVTALRKKLKIHPSPQDRLYLALLALYVKEDTLPSAEALASLERLEHEEAGSNLKLLGLVDVLKQALMRIEQERRRGKELTGKLQEKADRSDALKAELEAEKQRSEEMAQKLQKLLEIEKIMEKRK